MKIEDLVRANKEAWDEVAPRHRSATWSKLIADVKKPGFCTLHDVEKSRLLQMGIAGKSIAHPCCNSGVELLSLCRLGATNCTGFDISENFIEQAKALAELGNISCEFVAANVLEIPQVYHHQYDIVYLSVGTLGWMPELDIFFSSIKSLLRPNGQLFIYETHPLLDILSTSENKGLEPIYSYFRTEPIVEPWGLDYLGKTKYASKPTYWFHHKLSDIFTAILAKGFSITSFEELDKDISAVFGHLDGKEHKLPLSYLLTASLPT